MAVQLLRPLVPILSMLLAVTAAASPPVHEAPGRETPLHEAFGDEALVLEAPGHEAPGAASRSWLDGQAAGRTFADLSRVPATSLVPGMAAAVPLPETFRFRGALFDTLELGSDPGTFLLRYTDGGMHADPGGLLIRPAGEGLLAGPGAVLQLRQQGRLFAARALGLLTPWGEPVSFDVLIEPGEPAGMLTLQWLQAPSRKLGREGVLVSDLSADSSRAAPLSDGLDLKAGAVVSFPGDLPWSGARPKTGCGIAESWCDAVRRDDAGCYGPGASGYSTCSTTQAKRWRFREGLYCRSCPYTFYVTVECGTEMHLPFRDMEGNQIRITNVFTGVEMELEALNDCAKSAFVYCDFCPGGGLAPDPAGTRCPPGSGIPSVDCIPYLQRSTVAQWGWPLADRDGDGIANELPCGPPNNDTCARHRSGAWPGHEETNTDVILRGSPALCGVYRIDIVSGGFDWFLSANCTGIVPDDPAEIAQNFDIYQNCADALAAFDPVPELAITRIEFTGICPDIELIIEVTNLGCVDAPSSPVFLDFERANQTDIDVDLGVVPAGTSVTTRIPVSLRTVPQNVTATVDPFNIISECTEQPAGSFSGCAPTTGADTVVTTLCSCANTIVPALNDDSLVACNGMAVAIDASGSTVLPCSGGLVEYRVLDAAGAVLRDWAPDPMEWFSPARCPSIETFTMQVRCSSETGPDCIRSEPFTVECAAAPDLVVVTSATPVCQGDSVTITASPGFGTYLWEDGRAGRTFAERPGATTTYRVTATTAAGCVVQGEVTVDVVPDPVPGPLGASLRAEKAGLEVLFTYEELPLAVGSYRLLVHEPDGSRVPCADAVPPTKPTPAEMQAGAVLDVAAPGDPAPQLAHVGGIDTCPLLLFYKVVATSPCRGTVGPACNGFPMQWVPCP